VKFFELCAFLPFIDGVTMDVLFEQSTASFIFACSWIDSLVLPRRGGGPSTCMVAVVGFHVVVCWFGLDA